MRIRYAYKLTNTDGAVSYVTLSNKKSEEEVKEMFADKGAVSASFHERVRTGFRINEEGDLVETGLAHSDAAPKAAPASPEAPKSKKGKKGSKKASESE